MRQLSDKDGALVRGFNPYLHGARGLFAFMIVVFHVVNSGLPTLPFLSRSWPLFAMRSTEHGVELFFGISGVVIVGALRRAQNPWVFAAERATRIYPVLWATIGVIAVLEALSGYEGRHVPGVLAVVANLLAMWRRLKPIRHQPESRFPETSRAVDQTRSSTFYNHADERSSHHTGLN